MNYLKIGLAIGMVCLSFFSKAAIVISPDDQDIILNRAELEVFEAHDDWKLRSSEPQQIPFDGRHVLNPKASYWLHFTVDNQSGKPWVLEALDHHIDVFEVYLDNESTSTGSAVPFEERQYLVKNFVTDIPEGVSDIRVRIKARSQVGFELRLRSVRHLMAYSTTEYAFLGFYYGILMIMALYNLLLYFSSRERVYALYIFYVLSSVLVSLEEDGLGFQFLWSDAPGFNAHLTDVIAPILFMMSFTAYSLAFLKLREKAPRFYTLVMAVFALYILAHIANLVFHPIKLVAHEFYFVPFSVVFLSAIVVYRKGQKFSRYFILGNAFILISIVLGVLRENFLIQANVITVYSFNIGVVIEIVVLSFALGDRFRTLKKEKERSQQETIDQLRINEELQTKVNRELETKVQERTQDLEAKTEELKEANHRLEDLRDKLSEMNARLDLDNWKLTKSVKEQTQARLQGKVLSKEEFDKLYPDELSCLKILERKKWEAGFVCKKCGHENFSKKPGVLSRKCSKCGTEESVTAGTLFHGVRFSLQAAFFMVYMQVNDPKRYTIEELAQLVGVHRNTCSKFLNKVREAREESEALDGLF